VLLLHDQRVRNDDDRVADKGEGRGQREPLEDALLRLRNIIMDRLLDEVACRVGRGQRLAPGARGGGLCDVQTTKKKASMAMG
jgi:hypothetical protein